MLWLETTEILGINISHAWFPDLEQSSEPPGEYPNCSVQWHSGLAFLVLSEEHYTLHKLSIYGHVSTLKGYERPQIKETFGLFYTPYSTF